MRSLLIASLTLLCLTQTGQAQQAPSNIIAFCDSLSDVGNVARITKKGNSPRVEGYYRMTHYSDNIIWIEQLAKFWGLPRPKPGRGDIRGLRSKPNGTSWAWGGAEAAAGMGKTNAVRRSFPNLEIQVEQYLENNTPDPHALYVFWCGADNLLVGGKFGPEAAKAAVSFVIEAMKDLEEAGARQLLVLNMPKLGDTPAAQVGRIDEAAANFYAKQYNSFMEAQISLLCLDPLFRAEIYYTNAYNELALIVDTVNQQGSYTPDFFVPGETPTFTNVKDEALDVFNMTGKKPDGYLFWDSVHPTTQGHQIVAGKMLQSLSRVCSPG